MDGISEILATYNCVSLDEKIQFELDGVVEKELIVLKIWNFVFLVWITQP